MSRPRSLLPRREYQKIRLSPLHSFCLYLLLAIGVVRWPFGSTQAHSNPSLLTAGEFPLYLLFLSFLLNILISLCPRVSLFLSFLIRHIRRFIFFPVLFILLPSSFSTAMSFHSYTSFGLHSGRNDRFPKKGEVLPSTENHRAKDRNGAAGLPEAAVRDDPQMRGFTSRTLLRGMLKMRRCPEMTANKNVFIR